MTRKFSSLAAQARERYLQMKGNDMNTIGSKTTTVAAPPKAKRAKYLRDADGNLYLWTEDLAERGDLVAAYDPTDPDKYAGDQAQIALNREIELARERADAEEAARLEAVKQAEEAEAARREAEEIAQANARNLQIAEETLLAEKEKNAQEVAELKAKLDAMAKELAQKETPTVEQEKTTKKPAPRKRSKPEIPADEEAENVTQENQDHIDDFDQ